MHVVASYSAYKSCLYFLMNVTLAGSRGFLLLFDTDICLWMSLWPTLVGSAMASKLEIEVTLIRYVIPEVGPSHCLASHE